MSNYYLCSTDVARICCAGYVYMPVHHYTGSDYGSIYFDWLDDDIAYIPDENWGNAVLLKDLDDSTRLMLTLQDPLFKQVSRSDMSGQLTKHVRTQWSLLL